jgi:hypothetical protein
LTTNILGVDIGGVIIDRINNGTDTSFFTNNYLKTTAVPGVFDALRQLRDKKFGENIYLVSKCGKVVQDKTLHWLQYNNFYDKTGINYDHVHFCRQRHEKAGICQKFGITHFVDDRLEVLGNLISVPTLYLFQPRLKEVQKFIDFVDRVKVVDSWEQILIAELV